MIKSIKHIHKIFNNPFLFTPLFVIFYEKYSGQNKDILLSYLLLPLALHNETKTWLQNARSSSSLTTFGRNRENYYGLPERVNGYKHTTNKCLQYAIDNNIISINETLSIQVLKPTTGCSEAIKDAFKASENLVKIFKDIDVVSIYRSLGVKQL